MTDDTTNLTHTTETGSIQMVDIGEKATTQRRAVARGELHIKPETVDAIKSNEVGKGEVIATGRIGAIQAAKQTPDAIPLCHQLPLSAVETHFQLHDAMIELEVAVETTAKTGCEMEALHAVTTGLTVIWDMVKAIEKNDDGQYPETTIQNVRITDKRKEMPD